ncbi:hypothetical protein, partial [Paenarthrobacter sp. NCHU4564]|uniref:hypothetical protein n=1 Tax=Paenarthrobacter sp. NCHU4564 TaxID=3451353 RepID=UPI003F9C9DDC
PAHRPTPAGSQPTGRPLQAASPQADPCRQPAHRPTLQAASPQADPAGSQPTGRRLQAAISRADRTLTVPPQLSADSQPGGW